MNSVRGWSTKVPDKAFRVSHAKVIIVEDVLWLTAQSWWAEWGHCKDMQTLESDEAGWHVKRAASHCALSCSTESLQDGKAPGWHLMNLINAWRHCLPFWKPRLARTWCKVYSSTMTEQFWGIGRFPCSQDSKHLSIRLKFIWLERSFSSSKIFGNI